MIRNLSLETPAFVYDESKVLQQCRHIRQLLGDSDTKILFPLKTFAVADALALMACVVDGFAASSLFEAVLSREVMGNKGTVHITTPGLRSSEIEAIGNLCDYVSFNSLSQWFRFGGAFRGTVKCGLRVNPQLSLLEDDRYNPCRKYSKLGVSLDQLVAAMDSAAPRLHSITGLHFHSNCDSTDSTELLGTIRHLEAQLKRLLEQIEWINLGGGYLFNELENADALHEALNLLRSKYDVQVFIEPGASVIRQTAYLVSRVVDLFMSDGKTVAVLDTTVNHMPEVFEYQFNPEVAGHVDGGRHKYLLAGCTCLAGDVFGEYAFDEPLDIGSHVIFLNAGAYTLVKAHMFNGVNLPTIYSLNEMGQLVLKKAFTYSDFASRCGVDSRVAV